MKKLTKGSIVAVLAFSLVFGFASPTTTLAATSPTLVGAAPYSVLGATTVTNTGATVTVGEVGVSAGTAITGFPPGIAGGNNAIHLHSNDASAIAAQADNLSAFTALNVPACGDGTAGGDGSDGAGPVPGINYGAITQDLVGKTLVPGVYCANVFQLSGTLTLDDTGAPGGVWIFRSAAGAAALTTTAGTVVFKTHVASACNVWWRVASSATLGTGTSFLGNILALTSISLATGATLNGRAMVQTGAVTLDTNTISGCAVPLVPAHITLDKIVNGGPTAESAWTLTADGPTTISGPGATGATDVVGDVQAGTYNLSESTGPSRYSASSWSCVVNGGAPVPGASVTLTWGDTATCTITNTYHAPTNSAGTHYGCKDPQASNYEQFAASDPTLCVYATAVVAPAVVATTTIAVIPSFPNTGIPPSGMPWNIVMSVGILIAVSTLLVVALRKRSV